MEFSYKQELLRKSVHLSSLWMVVALFLIPQTPLLILFGTLLVLNIAVEYGYYKNQPFCNTVYGKLFGKMLRERETDGKFRLSGSPYVLGAAFAVTLLFPKEAAATAMAVMLLGDTAAALVGILKNEILRRGEIPFYCVSQSHILSMNTAVSAGFLPAWTEIYAAALTKTER